MSPFFSNWSFSIFSFQETTRRLYLHSRWTCCMVYDSLCGYAHHLTLLLFHHSLHLYHPSALNTFEQIVYSAIGKQIVVFLDYDGTLSPIVADPDKAFMTRKDFLLFPFFLYTHIHWIKLMFVINPRLCFLKLDESNTKGYIKTFSHSNRDRKVQRQGTFSSKKNKYKKWHGSD